MSSPNSLHCPRCASEDLETTCIGVIHVPGVPDRDPNTWTCLKCRWKGHDLDLLTDVFFLNGVPVYSREMP